MRGVVFFFFLRLGFSRDGQTCTWGSANRFRLKHDVRCRNRSSTVRSVPDIKRKLPSESTNTVIFVSPNCPAFC